MNRNDHRPPKRPRARKMLDAQESSGIDTPSARPPTVRPSSRSKRKPFSGLPKQEGSGTLSWSFGGITISVRLLVLMVVVAAVVVTVVPVAFQWLQQEQAYRSAVEEVAQQSEYNQQLREQLADWEDEGYITAQARERLGFVREGETQFVVIDAPQSGEEPEEHTEVLLGPPKPWSWLLLEALEDADDPPPSEQHIRPPGPTVRQEAPTTGNRDG